MPIFEKGWILDHGHDYQIFAIYIQDVHQILPNLSVTLGGRFDYDSEAGFIFNPRIGMNYEPTNYTFFKALYGEAYRAPTANEQYKIMGRDKGNSQLRYEEIKTLEFVLGYKTPKAFTQATFYVNWLDNIIMNQVFDTASQIKSYYNSLFIRYFR